jgi:hypothetical protein
MALAVRPRLVFVTPLAMALLFACTSEVAAPERSDTSPVRSPTGPSEVRAAPADETPGVPSDDPDAGTPTPDDPCPPILSGPIPPVFLGAPAYTFQVGPSSRHAGHGGNGNPAGRPCINCHNPGGTGKPFLFAGTVSGTAGVDVRVRESRGRVLNARTDADGNFFFRLEQAPACFEFPLRGGIRTSRGEKSMPQTQRYGNCNGCHVLSPP